ncbi:MAG: hypothetical protein ACR2QJ_13360 [Geminicoccaceae bacterium]
MTFRYPLKAASSAVVVLTFVLFAIALFTKGFTHDLLLETGVFLVSVKLIIMNIRNAETVEEIETKLDQILAERETLQQLLANSKKA